MARSKPRIIGILALGVVGFVFLLALFPAPIQLTSEGQEFTGTEIFADLEISDSDLFIPVELVLADPIESELFDEPPESDETQFEQIFDTAPKIGIEVDVILIDSDFKEIDVPTNFLNIPLTLLDPKERILDLGSITIGFNAVSNVDAIHDITGSFEIILNSDITKRNDGTFREQGSILASEEFFIRGTPDENDKIKLETTGDSQTLIFKEIFRDHVHVGDNKYQVFIKDVTATVGEGFDTTVYKFTGDFIAYTLRFDFDNDKNVIRDSTGKAISVYVSDSTITECGMNRGNINNFINVNKFTRRGTDVGFPTTVQTVTIFDDPNKFPIVTSEAPLFGNRERDIFKQGCAEKVSGIPRASELIFKVRGIETDVTTKKTQQNFIVKCVTNFDKNRDPITSVLGFQGFPLVCQSNFGFACTADEFETFRGLLRTQNCGVK